MHIAITELLDYTDEERRRWETWFRENGEELLKMPMAGDRDTTVGGLILHIFGPEWRYVRRMEGEAVPDYRGRPCHRIDELFGFGLESRNAMRRFVRRADESSWDRMVAFELAGKPEEASVRKIVLHVLIHEIRHWAQIARMMRERGFPPPGLHDLLASSALA